MNFERARIPIVYANLLTRRQLGLRSRLRFSILANCWVNVTICCIVIVHFNETNLAAMNDKAV